MTTPTPAPNPDPWFDAHLDLAFLAETGRDMHVDPEECRGRFSPAAITLPSLAEGNVRRVLATVFTEAIEDPSAPGAETGAFAYPMGNQDAAYVSGMRQLKLYHAWQDAGVISLPNRTPLREPEQSPSLHAGVLVENADPITDPDELGLWADGGVVAIGLTWVTEGRYASGNGVPSDGPETGLTDAGRALVKGIDELGIVHDASHLNDRSLADLFDATDRRIIASHSNCRSLMKAQSQSHSDPKLQRHLTDDAIHEITRRDGVIGLNLFSFFLDPGCGAKGRASIDHCVRHIEHVCDLAGDRTHVGLGSDMDGGLAADRLPEGIDCPADLHRLTDALHARGWSDDEIAGFRELNWRRVFDF